MEETCFSLFLTFSATLDIICKTNIRHWKVEWKEKWPRVLSNNMVMSSLDFLLFTYFFASDIPHLMMKPSNTETNKTKTPNKILLPPAKGQGKRQPVISTQSYLTVCNTTDYSLPGSSVHEIVPIRILKWVAILPQGIFPTQWFNPGALHYRQILNLWTTEDGKLLGK